MLSQFRQHATLSLRVTHQASSAEEKSHGRQQKSGSMAY